MANFISGILQNLVADLIVILLGGFMALVFALRARWRLIGATIRLAKGGVSNVFVKRSEYISRRSRSVDELIESAKRDFTYIGTYFSLATEQSRIDTSFKALLAKGCRVTIVLLDSASPNATIEFLEDHFALARNTLAARTSHAVEYFISLRDSLAPGQKNLLDLRLHRIPLTASVFILDQSEDGRTMLVDQKWYGVGRDKSLGVEFSKKRDEGLQGAVYSSFLKVLENSKPA